jgi:hypothetical protein
MSVENKVPVPAARDSGDTVLLLDQYKAYLSDLGNVGTRFTTMTAYYVSVISALVGLLALKEKAFTDIDSTVLYLVCDAGFTVSVLWSLNVNFFRHLFRAKLCVLSDMENRLPFQPFSAEYKTLRKARQKGWSRLERFVPLMFAALFLFIAGARLMPTLRRWCP